MRSPALPARYTSKLLSPNVRPGKPNLGPISLGPLLGALGLKLALVADEEALAKVRDRLPQRGACGSRLDDAKGEAWYGA